MKMYYLQEKFKSVLESINYTACSTVKKNSFVIFLRQKEMQTHISTSQEVYLFI